jgi:hypothetical protein
MACSRRSSRSCSREVSPAADEAGDSSPTRVLVAKTNPPSSDFRVEIDALARALASANYFADSVCTTKLSPPAEQGSTAKMLRCLQEDAFRVTDGALHLMHEFQWQGFALALQELWFAAQKLQR